VEAIQQIQEYGADVSVVRPVARAFDYFAVGVVFARVLFLEDVAAALDREYWDEHNHPRDFRSSSTSDVWESERGAEGAGTEHLSDPVQSDVEGARARVELREVDAVELVRETSSTQRTRGRRG
jgi:hypothetical protein